MAEGTTPLAGASITSVSVSRRVYQVRRLSNLENRCEIDHDEKIVWLRGEPASMELELLARAVARIWLYLATH